MTQTSPDTLAAFLGIDWADAKHDMCLQAAGSAKRECWQLEHTPEAIDAWGSTLRTTVQRSTCCHLPRTHQRAHGFRPVHV